MKNTEVVRTTVEIQKAIWVRFRAVVESKGLKLRYALTEAVRLWLEKYDV